MENRESLAVYNEIGEQLAAKYGVEQGQMFGKKCLKHRGKAFAAFYQDEMAFKLKGSHHADALAREGARLWDPSGKNKPMKEWVQVPNAFSLDWRDYALKAMNAAAPDSGEE